MKRLTTKDLLGKIEDSETRLAHDENSWLKSLGELGDLARMIMKIQQDQIDQSKLILSVIERIQKIEEGIK